MRIGHGGNYDTGGPYSLQVFSPSRLDLLDDDLDAWIVTDAEYRDCHCTLYYRTEGRTGVEKLRFDRMSDAQRFYVWNMANHLCEWCCSERRTFSPAGSRYCAECRDLLATHAALQERYQAAASASSRSRALLDEIERWRQTLEEFTAADKVAVIDRLLSEDTP